MARDGIDKTLDRQALEKVALKIKAHLSDELALDIGRFEAEGLVEAVAALIGPHFYNEGLRDAQALLARQVDEINDALFEMERPTDR
ncbi:DUF2164 domain-containing protein [Rhizobium sp. G187]|uniref:DUF2164 domain-containing protein n=1 Tax=Rhizobium sp. G187 TaxID=3451352 RepID=UPI003EE64596